MRQSGGLATGGLRLAGVVYLYCTYIMTLWKETSRVERTFISCLGILHQGILAGFFF